MDDQRHPARPSALSGLDGAAVPPWLTSEAIDRVGAAEPRPFDDAEYDARLERVRGRMARLGVDGMIVFRPSSVEYLCGYHTAETAPQPLVVTDTATALYVPDLELGRAIASSRVDQLRFSRYTDALQGLRSVLDHVVAALPSTARVAVETAHTSTPPSVLGMLAERGAVVVDADHLVERERLVLSPAEIRCVEQAASVTEAGVRAAVAEAGRADATESSVAAAVAAALVESADSVSAWGPVVVTGNRAGIPHSSWLGHPLADGPTFLEFAGTHHRYHAPVMRTVLRGRLAPEDQLLAELARTSVAAVLEHARPGVPCSRVAAEASAALGPLPDDVVFHQLFGYPVGLAHKPHWMDGMPFHITASNHEPLREGMVFHIPGSFRRFGRACVGLSQTFVVDRDGARALTHGAAELLDLTGAIACPPPRARTPR
ncbi:Xaa-Pro peptidase family protein [Saccharopolyspora sp. NPDC002686]|uniref:M24 family metallopeptidase n=1 Tax=Saccharopolyspora sp. NPDC002686 TaxID=3154541 RepID=UPI00331F5D35